VRIKVAAAALNPVDAGTWSGSFGPPGEGEHFGLGWDVAGTIDAIGTGAELATGTPVIAIIHGAKQPLKAQAEYVVVDASAVAPAPPGLDAQHASTLPLNALTAAQALDQLALQPGDTLLITGAAGSVGGYTVELARRRGLKTVALADAADEEFVTSVLGATWFVPRSDDPAAAVRLVLPDGVDGAIDLAMLAGAVLGAIRDGGTFVTTRMDARPEPERGIRVHLTMVTADGERLASLAALADAGHLTTRVAETYPLSQASQAHARLARGGLRGRIVLLS
jgi:NADPH:quinone reductase-like Zn-dependent oxidoreductase